MIVERPDYMDKLRMFRDTDLIKVVTGVRRCGKSTLLQLYRNELRNEGVADSQIVRVDLDDFESVELREARSLYAFLKSRLIPGTRTYIFLDEAQLCPGFQDVVNTLNKKPDTDVYLTGSNAMLLSGELATLLSGRYIEIPMLPLSFREFVAGAGNISSLSAVYTAYISKGGFPYVLQLPLTEQVHGYLTALYDSIVARDIFLRHSIRNTERMVPILRFLLDSIGNRMSMKRIADTLTSSGRKTDVHMVETIMQAFTDSFLLYRAGRYDIKGRAHLRTLEKYYGVDMGLRNVIAGAQRSDAGSMLENIVYLELLRRGHKVYTGKLGNEEVDFVAMKPGELRYYQVAATVRDPAVLGRELSPLHRIRDAYPKTLLTLDEDPSTNHNGIRQLNALSWLMDPSLE